MKGGIILALALASLALAGCTSEEQKRADAIKAFVAHDMRDPAATQFRAYREPQKP